MRLKKRLIGLLVLIALFVTISIALAEKDEIRYNLNNCISVCSDEDGCICPNYCIKTKDIDYGKNCRGYPGGCSKENTMYWVRDNICSYTCGNSYEEMMLEKGYEKVDYNCYTNEIKTQVVEVDNEVVDNNLIEGSGIEVIENNEIEEQATEIVEEKKSLAWL